MDRRDKDAFELFNEGVDRIAEEFKPCSQYLQEIRELEMATGDKVETLRQERDEEIRRTEAAIAEKRHEEEAREAGYARDIKLIEEHAADENRREEETFAEQEKESLNKRREYTGEIENCRSQIKVETAGIKPPLDREEIGRRTEEYRKDEAVYQETGSRYVKRRLRDLRPGYQMEELSKAGELKRIRQDRESTVRQRAIECLESSGMAGSLPGETALEEAEKNSEAIRRDKENLVKAYADEHALARQNQAEKKAGQIEKKHKNNQEVKEALRVFFWWMFCFPRNLLKLDFPHSDICCAAAAALLAAVLFVNPGAFQIIILLSMAAGVVMGFIEGYRRNTALVWTILCIVKQIMRMGFKIIPYPLLIFCITRKPRLFLIWAAVCLLLYFGYDAYYFLRRMGPSYKRLYKKYLAEGEAFYGRELSRLEELLASFERFKAEAARKLEEEIGVREKELSDLRLSIKNETDQLWKKFEESAWAEYVAQFQNKLESERQTAIEKKERVEGVIEDLKAKAEHCQKLLEEEEERLKQLAAQKTQRAQKRAEAVRIETEKAHKTLEAGREAARREIMELEKEKKGKEQTFEAREAEIRRQGQAEKAETEARFRTELSRLTDQMRADGFERLCGFDYRKAWAMLHGMATNTMCMPANVERFMEEFKRAGTGVLQQMLEKAVGAPADKCCFMPGNIIYGYEACDLEPEIRRAVESVLKEGEEFKSTAGWDAAEREICHIECPPADGLYRLKLINSQTKPVLFFYDLGDLETNESERESLRDFIVRNFVYGPLMYINNNRDYFRCDVLVSARRGHEGDYIEYESDLEECFKVHASGQGKVIETRYQEGRSVQSNLKGASSLYEKNKARALKETLPTKEDKHRILIITNADYKDFSNTKLDSLVDLAGRGENQCGVYPYLFVDLNRLSSDMSGAVDKSSVESCMTLAKPFKGAFLYVKKGAGAGQYLLEEWDLNTVICRLETILNAGKIG